VRSDFPLAVQMLLNCFGYFLVTLLLIPDYLLREYLCECRPICITLAFRYFRNILMLPEMIDKLVTKLFLAQDRLSPHFRPDRFTDSPLNKLFIFFLGLSPLPAELAEDPVYGKTGMRSFSAGCRPITAPFPGVRSFNHLCANGIQDDVATDFQQVAVFLDQDGLISPLEQMTHNCQPLCLRGSGSQRMQQRLPQGSPKRFPLYNGSVPRQFGYFGQPQNCEPTFVPRFAVRLTIAVPHIGQAGATTRASELIGRSEELSGETRAA